MNGTPSHFGDLHQLTSDFKSAVKYFTQADRLKLKGIHSIIGKSVSIYENADDLGLGGDPKSVIDGNSGRILGCCNIVSVSGLDALEMQATGHYLGTL